MIINRRSLLMVWPIKDMVHDKRREHGVSWGMSEAGYDIRIKQEIIFRPENAVQKAGLWVDGSFALGRFALASSIEEFQMPVDMVGVVHDKSTWARRGLSVFNTVIESGWNGFLTLELVYHGQQKLTIPAGAGIAQVVFHKTSDNASYDGKYQGQPDRPVEAIDG
jgi:dCTP deaminase